MLPHFRNPSLKRVAVKNMKKKYSNYDEYLRVAYEEQTDKWNKLIKKEISNE